VFNYLRNISPVKSEEEYDEEIQDIETNEATEKIIDTVEKNIEDGTKEKVKYAIKSYLKKEPETVEKIIDNKVDDKEKHVKATASVLSKVSGERARSYRLSLYPKVAQWYWENREKIVSRLR
jgi:hypothetical protein